jgi:succinate dehydrogenase hydrophobic anchor subunit
VVEDYVARHGTKVIVLLLLNFLHVVVGALGVFSVLRIAFGTPA